MQVCLQALRALQPLGKLEQLLGYSEGFFQLLHMLAKKAFDSSSRQSKVSRLLLLFPSLFHGRMGLLTASFLALGHHFALGVGSCDAGNSRTCLGSPEAGRGQWLRLAWELLGFPSLVLSAAEGLVLSFGQASPLSSVDSCMCPNLAEGLKRRERRGNTAAHGQH